MASVFLSYDREDINLARPVALALEKAGHSVWWDRHIKGGAQFSKEIEEALKRADAIVVLWSRESVESAWVRDEAAAGRDRARLVPVNLDATGPPLGFRQYQTIDLSPSKGRLRPEQLDELLSAIAAVTGTPAPRVEHNACSPHRMSATRLAAILGLAAGLLVAIYLGWRYLKPSPAPPTIAVAVADGSPAAKMMARDLLVKLGSLQAVKAQPIRIVDQLDQPVRNAELVFRLSSAQQTDKPSAGLVLISKREGAILWSKDFEQPSGKLPDLQQQIAVTAARVLGCALEALSEVNQRLPRNLIGTYLNGCAALDETHAHDVSNVIPLFRQVTDKAPNFRPAWAKLLIAETDRYVRSTFGEQEAMKPQLREHIAYARRLEPPMPEPLLAQVELLPANAFYEKLQLVQRAARMAPDNVYVLETRAGLLMETGLMNAAAADATRAASLDPLSPAMRNLHISALAYANRFDDAKDALLQAERLWPGAATLIDARYRFSLRYGDPSDAARLERAGAVQTNRVRQSFLRARIAPTKANIDETVAIHWAVFRRTPDAIGDLIQALGEFGREEELFPVLMEWKDTKQIRYFTETLFRPTLKDLRHDRRFMQVARRLGLLQYWTKSGTWPDFCDDPDLPYNCKEEAAKLAS